MIKRFRHKGLARFFETGDTRGINAQHADWLRLLLTTLSIAEGPTDMNLPGYRLHPLKGERKGQWAVSVSGNWRLVFVFDGVNAMDVDLVDYHREARPMQMHDPAHPGEVIREACLKPLNLTVTSAAAALGVTRKALSDLLNGHSGVSSDMAIRLEQVFGSSAETWLRMQLQRDLWEARQRSDAIKVTKRYAAPTHS